MAILNQRRRGPGEHVDESRRDGESLCVDDRFRFCRFEITNASNPIAANCDVGLFGLGTSPVVNRAVFDDDIEIACSRRRGLVSGEYRGRDCDEYREPNTISLHGLT